MRLSLLLSFCLLAARLSAYGGSEEDWLSGTQSWDSVPPKEVDVALLGGDDYAGLAAKAGIFDILQASADWRHDLGGAPESGELGLKLREPDFPRWRPALAVYGLAPFAGSQWQRWGGLALGWEPFDLSLALNAEAGEDGHWRLRAGIWTDYVAEMLRLGAEAEWPDGALAQWTPQLLINGPGDLSLVLGARLDASGSGARWMMRLSYQIFPNP